ncbi:type II toxin-antitoxin system HicA family toxin [Patescibacteria group bacterium]|nr:type II toxin-antitoxin system HicA family toxin [Patescibacteria group bacterium]
MPKLPVVSGKKLLATLVKHDYVAVRKKGSHVFVESSDGKHGTVIPIHGDEDLGLGLLKSILNDLDISVDDLRRMLRR